MLLYQPQGMPDFPCCKCAYPALMSVTSCQFGNALIRHSLFLCSPRHPSPAALQACSSSYIGPRILHFLFVFQPKSYQFGYSVRDYASGNDYNRHETSDGNTIQGEYRVQLPDGRTQIVTYIADWKNGYRANVRYEGEAYHPTGNSFTPSTNYAAPSSGYNGGSSYAAHGGSNAGYAAYSNGYDSGHAYGGSSSSSYAPPGYGK